MEISQPETLGDLRDIIKDRIYQRKHTELLENGDLDQLWSLLLEHSVETKDGNFVSDTLPY
jgi:hypothetical protein